MVWVRVKWRNKKKRVINKQSGINLWSNYITFRYATVATNSHERCYGCTALWGEKVFPINGIQISKFIEKKNRPYILLSKIWYDYKWAFATDRGSWFQ